MRLGLIIVSITGTFFLMQFVYYARGHRGEDPPDPIPNSEVKLPIADDTACWWESRSLRAFFCPFHPPVYFIPGGFFFAPGRCFSPIPISAGRAGKKFAPQTREDCLQRV